MSTYKDLTKKIIAGMLKENTGQHFLDSGGAYGRNYERNQLITFENTPRVYLEITKYGIEYTRSLYWFLSDNLEYSPKLTNSFNSFAAKKCDKYDSWYECLNKWFDWKIKTGFIVKTGIHGEGNTPVKADDIMCENIYNGENNLSQIFQYWLFQDDYNTDYIALMVHGGCDVRGGYTSPKFFELRKDSFFMVADGYIRCENNHAWYTDDDYNWYPANNEKYNLDKCQFLDYDDLIELPEYQEKLSRQLVINPAQLPVFEDYKPSVINPVFPLYIDGQLTVVCKDNKIGLCPLCGTELSG